MKEKEWHPYLGQSCQCGAPNPEEYWKKGVEEEGERRKSMWEGGEGMGGKRWKSRRGRKGKTRLLLLMTIKRRRRRRKIWELAGKWRIGNVGDSSKKSIRATQLNNPAFHPLPCLVSSKFRAGRHSVICTIPVRSKEVTTGQILDRNDKQILKVHISFFFLSLFIPGMSRTILDHPKLLS